LAALGGVEGRVGMIGICNFLMFECAANVLGLSDGICELTAPSLDCVGDLNEFEGLIGILHEAAAIASRAKAFENKDIRKLNKGYICLYLLRLMSVLMYPTNQCCVNDVQYSLNELLA